MHELTEAEEDAQTRKWILEILAEEGPTNQKRLGLRIGTYSYRFIEVADAMADEGLIQRFIVEGSPHIWFANENEEAQPLSNGCTHQYRERLYDMLLKSAAEKEYYDSDKVLLWLAAQIVENTKEEDLKGYLSVIEGCRPASGFTAGDTWEQRKGTDPGPLGVRVAAYRAKRQALPESSD